MKISSVKDIISVIERIWNGANIEHLPKWVKDRGCSLQIQSKMRIY